MANTPSRTARSLARPGSRTDVAQEVLGEGADQGSLRDFYVALRLRVAYDPSTRIASATMPLDERLGSVCVRGGT